MRKRVLGQGWNWCGDRIRSAANTCGRVVVVMCALTALREDDDRRLWTPDTSSTTVCHESGVDGWTVRADSRLLYP